MSVTIEVNTPDLMVGDKILGAVLDSGHFMGWSTEPMVVSKPLPVPNMSIPHYDFLARSPTYRGGMEYVERRNASVRYRIVRASTKAAASGPKKHIDEYPGSCPLCGGKAYVSALAVAHKNEEAAKGCTARRV